MANKFIDATLRFRDQFTGKMDVAIQKIETQEKSLKKLGGKMVKTGKQMTSAGKTMSAGVTAPVLAIGTASLKTAMDFEYGMDKVKSISGATANEMDLLTKKAKDMGAKTKFSATESADAFSYMAMAGWKTRDMLDGIEGIMYLAGATGEDLASTSDIVTDALTAFGLQAKDTNRFVDVLAQTANASNTSVSLMGETFKFVAPVAGALGYSIEDTSTAIGIMANSGIKASQAGTALRSLLTNLSKPTDSMKKAMDKLGISLTDNEGNMKSFSEVMGDLRNGFSTLSEAEKAQYAATIAGKTGMSGLLAIVNSSEEDFNTLAGAIYNADGAAKQMYDTANDNLTGKMTVLKSTIESISISIGERLTPYIGKLTEFVQGLADKFNSLSDEQLDTIIKFAGIAAAIGPVLIVVGKATTGFGKLLKSTKSIVSGIKAVRSAFSSVSSFIGILNPKLLLVVAIVGAVAAIAYVVYKNWDKIKPVFDKVGNALKLCVTEMKANLEQFVGKAKENIEKIKEKFNEFVQKCKNTKDKVTGFFTNIKSSIVDWYNGCVAKLKNFIGSCSDMVAKVKGHIVAFISRFTEAKNSLSAIIGNIKGYFDGIKTTLGGVISFITGVFTGNWSRAWQGIKDIFKGIFGSISSVVKAPLNAVIGLINGAIGAINKISFTVPEWVPGLGGKTFGASLPKMPYLYKGTNYFSGGPAVIHDKGAEIVDLPRGTRVIPHDKSLNEAYKMGKNSGKGKSVTIAKLADTIVVREEADIDRIVDELARRLEDTSDDYDDVA